MNKQLDYFETIIYKLEHIMYGHNYQVKFGVDLFQECPDLEEFKIRLKKKYPRTKPESVALITMTISDFWDEIDVGFTYRGDDAAGLNLSKKEEENLEILQKEYKDLTAKYIVDAKSILSYPDETGIPGYPVYWDYRFILQLRDDTFLFIYASASD
jgi:hypothetical protein